MHPAGARRRRTAHPADRPDTTRQALLQLIFCVLHHSADQVAHGRWPRSPGPTV